MPHALTERQREYLEFIRNYIPENERSPPLDEIASHFGVAPSTAHKILKALRVKGFLYFTRSDELGYYIRLIERAGLSEVVMDIPVVANVDAYGEVCDFKRNFDDVDCFTDMFLGVAPYNVFALVLVENIPQVDLLAGDIVVFDVSKRPQTGDICIGPIGERLFLMGIGGRTIDRQFISFETGIKFPIPEELIDPAHKQYLFWYPLVENDETHDWFDAVAEEQGWPIAPYPPKFIMATAMHLWRSLK